MLAPTCGGCCDRCGSCDYSSDTLRDEGHPPENWEEAHVMNFMPTLQKKRVSSIIKRGWKKRALIQSLEIFLAHTKLYHISYRWLVILLFFALFPFSPSLEYQIIPLKLPVPILKLYSHIYAILLLPNPQNPCFDFYYSLPLQSPAKIALLMT